MFIVNADRHNNVLWAQHCTAGKCVMEGDRRCYSHGKFVSVSLVTSADQETYPRPWSPESIDINIKTFKDECLNVYKNSWQCQLPHSQ